MISIKAVKKPKSSYRCAICERFISGEHIYAFGGEQYGKPQSIRVCRACSLSDVVTDEWRKFAERHLTPLALDGAIAPDNQQVLPADVLVGEGTLPEPPRQ